MSQLCPLGTLLKPHACRWPAWRLRCADVDSGRERIVYWRGEGLVSEQIVLRRFADHFRNLKVLDLCRVTDGPKRRVPLAKRYVTNGIVKPDAQNKVTIIVPAIPGPVALRPLSPLVLATF